MPDIHGLEPRAVTFSPDRNDQVTLFFKVIEGGLDFHSLRWDRNNDGEWVRQLEITRDQFQEGCTRARWAYDLHSFDSAKGHAIIKIAEEGESATLRWRDVHQDCLLLACSGLGTQP